MVILGLFFGYKLVTKQPEGITTAQVVRKTLVETVSANGQVKAHKAVDLKFNLPSKVVWVGVKEGDEVRAWQGVAALDQRQLQKDLETALSQYMAARWDFDTMHLDTYKDQIITDVIKRELDKSQFNMDRSVLNVEIKDIVLKEAVLVSPIKGTVVDTNDLVAGENLTAGDLGSRFIRVVDWGSLYFGTDVDEVDYKKVKMGQEAEVTLDAFPGESCSGKVVLIGKEGKETTGGVVTIPVEVELQNCDWDLALGLNGEANLVLGKTENALVIPKKYLVNKDGQEMVWVQTGQSERQRRMQAVQVGKTTSTEAEVVEGLTEGQTLVYVPGA